MGMFDFAKSVTGTSNPTKREAVFTLTESGRQRLRQNLGSGSELTVMGAISQLKAPCTVEEISDKSGESYSKTKHIMLQLLENQLVTKAGARVEE
jgi:hypothetical protein